MNNQNAFIRHLPKDSLIADYIQLNNGEIVKMKSRNYETDMYEFILPDGTISSILRPYIPTPDEVVKHFKKKNRSS